MIMQDFLALAEVCQRGQVAQVEYCDAFGFQLESPSPREKFCITNTELMEAA